MAVYAIGDLQGCHDEFLALLDALRFDPATDTLWLTGDLVNRGPDSLAVLRAVRGLGSAAHCVLGNHDLHLLAMAWAPGTVRRREAGLEQVLDAPDAAELLGWLAGLPLLHRDRALGWTLVHAGLPPAWTIEDAESAAREVERALADSPSALLAQMYGDEPSAWDPALTGIARLRYAINCLTRLRYVDAEGRLLLSLKGPPGEAPAGALPWHAHPSRASAGERIVYGHWSAQGCLEQAGAWCLDGGCVWGGSLCALRLDAPAEPVCLPCRGHQRPGPAAG